MSNNNRNGNNRNSNNRNSNNRNNNNRNGNNRNKLYAINRYGENCNVNAPINTLRNTAEGFEKFYEQLLKRVSSDSTQLRKLRNFLLYCRSFYIPVMPHCNLFKNSQNLSLLVQYYMMLNDSIELLPYKRINLSRIYNHNNNSDLFRFGNCLSNNNKFVVSFYPSIELQDGSPTIQKQVILVLNEYYKLYEEAYRLHLIGMSDTHFTSRNFMQLSYRIHHGLYYDKSDHPFTWVGYSDRDDSVIRFIERRLQLLAEGVSESCTGEIVDRKRLEDMISIMGDPIDIEQKIEEISKHMFCKSRSNTSQCATISPSILLIDYATATVDSPPTLPYCWKKQLVLGSEKDYIIFNHCTDNFRIMLDPMAENIDCYPYIGYNMVMNRMYLRFASENRFLLFPIKIIVPVTTTSEYTFPKLGRRVKTETLSKNRFLGFIKIKVKGDVSNTVKTSTRREQEKILNFAKEKNIKDIPMDKILMMFETSNDTSFNTRTGLSNPGFMLYDWQLYKYYIGSLSPKMNVTYTEFSTLTKYIGMQNYLYTEAEERQIIFMSRYTPKELSTIAPMRTELYENLVYMVIDYRALIHNENNNKVTNKSNMIQYYRFIDDEKNIIIDPMKMINVTDIYSKKINPNIFINNYWDQIIYITRNTNNDMC